MARNYYEPQTFESLDAFLGSRDKRKMCNNTYAVRYGADIVCIRHHATDILTYRREMMGYVEVDCNGYRSVTTKARLNQYLHERYGIVQRRFAWYVWNRDDGSETAFHDGMMVRTH